MVDYEEIDPGVRGVVKALNYAGFTTSDSGDGSKTDIMECAMEPPHVAGVLEDGGQVHAVALEAWARRISEIASHASGSAWECQISYCSTDKEWTWIAMPLSTPEHDFGDQECWCAPAHVCAECRTIGPCLHGGERSEVIVHKQAS